MSEQWGTLVPYFIDFKRNQIDAIKKIGKVYTCKDGDLVYLQGEFCDNWVVVNQGNFLTRTTSENNSVSEKILHEGDSFDLVSILNSSVTSSMLEAVGECSLFVVSFRDLKTLVRKSPEIISLIREKLPESEGDTWDMYFFNRKTGIERKILKIKESLLSLLVKNIPGFLILFSIGFPIYKFLMKPGFYVVLMAFAIFFFYFIFQIIISRLTFIEVSRESITKRAFKLKGFVSVNTSVPFNKVTGSKITYKNRLFRLFKLGAICFESPGQELVLHGVFKPEFKLKTIDDNKKKTLDINKGIDISSFKSTYCKQNNLFYIDNQLEEQGSEDFVFRKSILSFLIIGIPPFLFLSLTSVGLFFVFELNIILYLNIISFAYLAWHYWDWINDRYAFEGSKVVDIEKKPLWGKESRIEADISAVQSIKKEQKNLLEFLLNYGTIEIETLGEKIVYPFISDPDRVIDNLYLVKQFYSSRQESLSKMQRQEEFLNYTKYYQELLRK